MTVRSPWLARLASIKGAINQVLIVLLINIPTLSFGLALGWVSLASGEGGPEASRGAVIASVTTFTASLVGVPLSARALVAGRKVALIGTSFSFVICWSLKLASVWGGEWCIVAARIAAGLGSAAAWALSPLLAREMCSEKYRGAAVSALALIHNAGVLIMYLAADFAVSHRAVLWWCLGLALGHCVVFSFVPESPSFLAAKGKIKEARVSLAWFRGMSEDDPELETELAKLPPPEIEQTPFSLAKEMLKDVQRRKAFIIGAIAVIGQEACGVLAILQYAERLFVLAREEGNTAQDTTGAEVTKTTVAISSLMDNVVTRGDDLGRVTMMPVDHGSMPVELVTPARHAVIIGAVQLATSALSLYLVEKVGRRPLLIWCAVLTGVFLALAAWLVGISTSGTAVAIAFAIAADSAGLQPAPYAVLADMFHYQYRGCALMLVTAGACVGNAIEVAVFPAVVAAGGLRTGLILAAVITLSYALFAICAVPETRGKSPEEIYNAICPLNETTDCESGNCDCGLKKCSNLNCGTNVKSKETECTKLRLSTMGLLDKLTAWMSGGVTQATVLVLGLDNSGKSSLLNALRPPEQRAALTVPTVAQQQDNFQSGGVSFSAWDVSGAARMRALWERHYRYANAVIFVVDAADHLRLVVAREELELMLAHPDMFGRRIPLLVLANKSDASHALSATQVAAALALERIADKPWHICACSALTGSGLPDGIAWLARQLREQRPHK
ncbi:high-affinity hexose transporter HXT6-like [Maniola jurtina]|uniref:high-affinity hexose transporter HXT6-like n=1 Tax=Maniola jurtina TaxID=191418 RepID=UPI001E68E5E5|nr:high-affinity hexose transporter HXT6-like [Maniola jurtina]